MRRFALACALALLSAPAGAQVPFRDSLVQAPKLAPPERGSLAGQYSRVAFGPADLVRGGFALPSPFQAPAERGGMGVEPFPTYSPDAGISEWGAGWQASLALVRWRTSGDLDYATDDLTSPWGRLVRGSDGAWYPQGLQKLIRVDPIAGGFVASLPDGTQWTFDARIDTPAGAYAWYLTGAVSAIGRRTRLTYVGNASGRLFLSQISYGGNAGAFQHQIDLTYETVALPFTDYRSGIALVLDRRVTAVSMKSLQAGAMTERWRYALTYRNEGLGPAFFLTQVQQVFTSGQAAPPVAYDYAISSERFAAATFRPVAKLDAAVAQFGSDLFQANRAALMDTDLDARTDFEHSVSQTLLVQVDSSFLVQPLPPPPPDALVICRPPPSSSNAPRTLAQVRASDDAYRVVDLRSSNFGAQTTLTVCNREGQQLYAQALPPGWALGANTRLVDLNRDHQPDVLRAFTGGYQVIPNQSTAAGHAFGAPVSGTLDRSITGTTTWALDFNGDGIPDLVERTDGSLIVWMGSGNFRFGPKSTVFQLFSSSGSLVTGLSTFEFTFLDANKDGLTDVLAARSGVLTLFVNTGTRLVQTALPGLSFVDTSSSRAVLGDFAGSGDTEIGVVKGGHAYSLALAGADTALLRSADDGKGTVLRFAYGRSPAVPGTRQRQAVLTSLTVQTAGHDAVASQFAYQAPTLHTDGRFLVGFGNVTRQGAALNSSAAFLNGDAFAGLPASSLQHDLNSPLADEFEQRTYEDALYQGLPWKRLKAMVHGWQSPDGLQIASERTDYDTFEAEVCSSRTRRTGASGTLTTVDTRAQIAGLGASLHCLPARIDISGAHSDPSLDFSYTGLLTRNAAGLITQVQSQSAVGTLTLQTVAYNPDFTIASISTPGTGTESYVYDPATLILNEVHGADGVVVRVPDRDPLTDAVRTMQVDRGGQSYSQFFRYDALELLAKQWNSLGAASELNPNEILSYRFASGPRLATIFSSRLVDAPAGVARSGIDYLSGAGEPVATAVGVPQGWAFGPITERLFTTRDTNAYLRPTVPAATDPLSLDYAALLSSATRIRQSRATANDHEASSSVQLHADVQKQLATTLAVDQGGLVQTTTENGALITVSTLDAGRRTIGFRDEANVSYAFRYDALGRLREVDLPDGSVHRQGFDEHGRVASVSRTGIATVQTSYDGATGLVSRRTFLSPAGIAQRTVDVSYDAIGRKLVETHTDSASQQSYRYFYDGATPDLPGATSDRGHLTAVTGDRYSKVLTYRADGALLRKQVAVAGAWTVDSQQTYFEDDSIRQRNVTVLGADGTTVLASSVRSFSVDPFGRVGSVALNGAPLATLGYDENGQLTSATFASAEQVTLTYDASTRRLATVGQSTATWSASSSVRLNARGFLGQENVAVGSLSLQRAFGYSEAGYLTSAQDAQNGYAYGYDGFGLPSLVRTGGTDRPIAAGNGVLTAGGVQYRFDALGRTVQKGDLALAYGPEGHVASARRGTSEWTFLYDETGVRIAKLSGGAVLAAYVDDAVIDAGGLTEPLRFGGVLVGVVQGGSARLVAADTRGSVLADAAGAPRVPSPFGDRAIRPEVSPAIDYVEKGFDADLGVVRMGVRDYDPFIDRFLTPDPLYLEEPLRCVENPVDCNLYGYARNLPATYNDPDGRHPVLIGAGIGALVGAAGYAIFTPVEQWTLRGAGAAALGGAINGAIAGATCGASLLVQTTAGAGASIAAGVVQRGVETGSADAAFNGTEMLKDGVLGAAASYAGGRLSAGARGTAQQAEKGTSEAATRLQANRVAGKLGEDFLRDTYGGAQQVFKPTSLGARFIDNLVDGVAMESKVGRTALTSRVETQIAKDVELLKTPGSGVTKVEWHFFPGKTGVGPTPALEKLLTDSGIQIVTH